MCVSFLLCITVKTTQETANYTCFPAQGLLLQLPLLCIFLSVFSLMEAPLVIFNNPANGHPQVEAFTANTRLIADARSTLPARAMRAANTQPLPDDAAAILAKHHAPGVRLALAKNPTTNTAMLNLLVKDADTQVRMAALQNPNYKADTTPILPQPPHAGGMGLARSK